MKARVFFVVVPAAGLVSVAACTMSACIPPGNSTGDGGPQPSNVVAAPAKPSVNVMRAPFEDNFERTPRPLDAAVSLFPSAGHADSGRHDAAEASISLLPEASAEPAAPDLGPDWTAAQTAVWHIENGRLCGAGAKNHGVWLNKTLPVNARIEFDAVSYSPEGDLKAEVWGDGKGFATALSYTNATSYLAILGGWKNTLHVLARINEHGDDRKVIKVDTTSDDPREKPVNMGQVYHFKIERTDGHTVRWSVDGVDWLSYDDGAPLAGAGHDHFGFNNWSARVCFDNVKVTPL